MVILRKTGKACRSQPGAWPDLIHGQPGSRSAGNRGVQARKESRLLDLGRVGIAPDIASVDSRVVELLERRKREQTESALGLINARLYG